MFATRQRSRPRRATRFAPSIDSLSSRIAPTALLTTIEVEAPEEVSEPTTTGPTTTEPTTRPVDPELIEALTRFDRECKLNAMQL